MSPKDQALRSIGRTVVNFQRLEEGIRRLSVLAPIEGTLDDAHIQMQKRVQSAAEYTFGQAIIAWIDALEGRTKKPLKQSDLFSITLQSRISFPLDGSEKARHSTALRQLLEDRNRLIHQDFVQFDWGCDADCLKLHNRLEELNRSIDVELRLAAKLLRELRELVSVGVATIEVLPLNPTCR